MLQYKVVVKYEGRVYDEFSLYGERQDVIKTLKSRYNCNLSIYRRYVEVDVLSFN